MTTLAQMRLENVSIELDGDSLLVGKATDAQLAAIKADKPQILAALRSEALTGVEGWENSALYAGLHRCHRQTADNLEFGCSPKACKEVLALIEGLLEMPLQAAKAEYLRLEAQFRALLATLNEDRRLMLEDRALYGAVRHTFRKKEKINAAIF